MPTIDLAFGIVGTTIPLDHGYALFSALCGIVPTLHGDRQVGVHPIRGLRSAPNELTLTPGSRLRLRLPSEEVANFLSIAGSKLDLAGHSVRIGIPRVEALRPAVQLGARLVTYKNALDSESFLAKVRQEFETMNIACEPSLVSSIRHGWEDQSVRRVLRIKNRRIVGYALRVSKLDPSDSIRLQEVGLGGRRRMGCGVFLRVESVLPQ